MDESGRPGRGIALVTELAHSTGDKVVVVHVRESLAGARMASRYTLESGEDAHELVDLAVLTLADAGVSVAGEVRRAMNSFVGRELLNAARQHGAGLLVIGGRSRSRVAAAVSEKVTGYLVRRSPVPVLVVGEEPPAGAAGSAGRDG